MSLTRNSTLAVGLGALALLGLAAAPGAHANVIVQDGSFETPTVPPPTGYPTYTNPGYVYNPMGGQWTFSGDSGIVSYSPATSSGFTTPVNAPAPEDGNQYAFLQVATATTGFVSQSIVLPTTGVYDLSFYAAGRPDVNPGNAPYGPDGNADFDVTLTPSVGVSDVLGNFSTTSTTSGGGFSLDSASFTAAAGDYTLTFANTTPFYTGDHTAFIDNVNISPAPEPSQFGMLALVGVGLGGLMLRARKAKAAA
jgi:hypothetical protein